MEGMDRSRRPWRAGPVRPRPRRAGPHRGSWWSLAVVLLSLVGPPALADTSARDHELTEPRAQDRPFYDEITIVGTREDVEGLGGAADVIGQDILQRFAYADIQRIVRQTPGVSVQIEDGYGLRPNISIRGVASERSGRITLLEDNVLIAPAPYSAPSAYYFPTAGRMHAFEVLKGPAAITQGPYTIGGALNMVSTPIPRERTGTVTAFGGSDATWRTHGVYGGTTNAGLGFLVETHQWFSDGFQDIDRSGRDTGLAVRDYTLKLRHAPRDSRHAVEVKLQVADQESDQSYLGLGDRDFAADPYRRYGLSALDRIATAHDQIIVRYDYDLRDNARFTATAYRNEHTRDWFKTEGIDFDGSPDAQAFARTSWFNVIRAVNHGRGLAGHDAEDLRAILHGEADTSPGSIQLRSNAREYFSHGAQLLFESQITLGAAHHEIEVGLRLHEDEEDRLQRNSTYRQQGGRLVLDDLGRMGNAGNRVQEARATAIHFQDRITFGRWTITPGLRYEDIDQRRTRYETRAGRTEAPASRAPDNLRDVRANTTRVWLPGVGASYRATDAWRVFAGMHKGFTAPSNAPDVDEEEALNFEFGLRHTGSRARFEATAFLSDYDNLLGECTSSSGADCDVGDAFNGDAATVRGIELQFGMELAAGRTFAVPLELDATWMDAHFDSDIADTDFFGDVGRGDPIPYIPEWQAHATVGWLHGPFEAYAGVHYVDAVCVRASCGAYEATDAALTVDVSGSWAATERFTLLARVENLTDAEDLVGRHPYGARPNRGRTAIVGVRVGF